MIQVKSFEFNPFSENTYLLYDETKECVIIDPGCFTQEEKNELLNFIDENELKVTLLLNTHGHIDHVLGNKFVADKWGVRFGMSEKDLETYKAVSAYAFNFGIDNYEEVEPDFFIDENDKVEFGQSALDIIFVPGHSVGHIAFINKEQKFVIGGDVLFNGSIGRTDLPGGDFDTLIESIQSKLFTLEDDFTVYAGHGPITTIGKEKATNPFCGVSIKTR